MASNTQASAPSPAVFSWRLRIRILAVVLALAVTVFWAAKGANRGWTQNQVPVKELDEITGLEKITYEKRYVPGLDVLGGGLCAAFFLAAVSFLPKRKAGVANS
jgi:hypothetical protein